MPADSDLPVNANYAWAPGLTATRQGSPILLVTSPARVAKWVAADPDRPSEPAGSGDRYEERIWG